MDHGDGGRVPSEPEASECDGYASGSDHGSADAPGVLLYDDTGRADRGTDRVYQ